MKEKFIVITLLLILISFLQESCTNSHDKTETNNLAELQEHQLTALKILNAQCFTCHNPDPDAKTRVAPTLSDVRISYLKDGDISKDEFSNSLNKFLNYPSEENSLMPAAIVKYGIMPKLTYKDEDIKIIADYLYDVDPNSDEWLTMWNQVKTQLPKALSPANYVDKGREYAMATKTILGKNLLQAIQERGTDKAVSFCNTRAIVLTDSMSMAFATKIKRVSDKPRNHSNKANSDEIQIMESFKTAIGKNQKIKPVTIENDYFVLGYYPIETNKMCLQCHGVKDKDITTATLKTINKLYPSDQATGYTENQIRGMWVVEMSKN